MSQPYVSPLRFPPIRLIVAAVRAASVYLDLPASLAKAEILIAQAAAQGAQLVVFPETWLPGFPAWLDGCRDVNLWDSPAVKSGVPPSTWAASPRSK